MAMESGADVQATISNAMRLRLPDFKDQADSLTMEGMRRLLEKDLGLDAFSLDCHKRFIKQCLHECLHGSAAEDSSKDKVEGENGITKDCMSPDHNQDVEHAALAGEGNLHGSEGGKATDENLKLEPGEEKSEEAIDENVILQAIHKRVSYFKAHSETITYLGARRLLEEDLQLTKFTLDAYKTVIREKLNEVLDSVTTESANQSKTNDSSKVSSGQESKRKPRKLEAKDLESTGSDDMTDNDLEEADFKRTKEKISKHERKRKIKAETSKTSKKSRLENKQVEPKSSKQSIAKQDGESSLGDGSQSSDDNHVEKSRQNPSLALGRKVEHLKSIIRSCGICVPPSVYKKVKQAPESKQEANLIKELEDILRREGLSSNPSEKEIKEVRKNKERAKDIEGIDMTNIISGSRRMRTNSFIPPPKPKRTVESDESDEEDTEDGDSESEENSEASHEDDAGDESE